MRVLPWSVTESQMSWPSSADLLEKEHFFPHVPSGWNLFIDRDSPLSHMDQQHQGPSLEKQKLGSVSRLGAQLNKENAEYCTAVSSAHKSFQAGTPFDVISFLKSDQRDYLVRNDGERVGVDYLSGKFVMVCCIFVPSYWYDTYTGVLYALSSLCSELHDVRTDFELVLVAKMRSQWSDDEHLFDEFFSGFPSSCLAVPFWDDRSRDHICMSLGFRQSFLGILTDPCKNIVWHKCLYSFRKWGIDADAFPFTDTMLETLKQEQRRSWRSWSLDRILSCEPSDVLHKNPGGGLETVSVSELKGKLVGLYLCFSGELLPKLYEVYEECSSQNRELEIVVIYLPFNRATSNPSRFQELVNAKLEEWKVSWWVLPFKLSTSLKLRRLWKIKYYDKLVVLGRHGEFVEHHAEALVRYMGVAAYPFSRALVFEKTYQQVRELTLESLLVHGSQDYVLSNDHPNKVSLTMLRGMNVLVYLDFVGDIREPFFNFLVEKYHEIKARDHSFEVVFVGLHKTLNDGQESLPAMPWLICPLDQEHSELVWQKLSLRRKSHDLVAFGRDGRIRSLHAARFLSSLGVTTPPFDGADLHKEVIDRFSNRRFPTDDL